MSNNGWIAVDLDRTLAYYDHWRGETHVGEPIPAMVQRVKRWLADGQEVKIFTARVAGGDVPAIVAAIEAWCLLHLGQVLPVTNAKDFDMIELWDDRAVQVVPNVGLRVG